MQWLLNSKNTLGVQNVRPLFIKARRCTGFLVGGFLWGCFSFPFLFSLVFLIFMLEESSILVEYCYTGWQSNQSSVVLATCQYIHNSYLWWSEEGPAVGPAACIAVVRWTACGLFLCFLFGEGFLFPLLVSRPLKLPSS